MRTRYKLPFADLLKHHRRWEKLLAKAMSVSRTAVLKATQANETPLKAAKPAKETDRLQEITGFGTNPGGLRMLAYTPPSLPDTSALVVVLHGCQQTAQAYDQGSGWTVLARERGFAVVYAEQTRSNNPNLCFNWFRPSSVARDRGEAMSIRQMVATITERHGIDPKRVYITGLSAGGAMAASMLAAYPEVFCAGAIMAGLPHGAARDVQRAFSAMARAPEHSARDWGDLVRAAAPPVATYPAVSIWHGTRDATVSISNAYALLAQWLDVHSLDPDLFERSQVDGHLRRIWRNDAGEGTVEFYEIEGMGHGTPLKPRTGSRTRADTPGPFMLDAGISSTMHLATSWGLKKP